MDMRRQEGGRRLYSERGRVQQNSLYEVAPGAENARPSDKPAFGFRFSIFSCLSFPGGNDTYRNGEARSSEFFHAELKPSARQKRIRLPDDRRASMQRLELIIVPNYEFVKTVLRSPAVDFAEEKGVAGGSQGFEGDGDADELFESEGFAPPGAVDPGAGKERFGAFTVVDGEAEVV